MASILPMRVTSSEKFYITDDSPGYRMSFVVDHTFDGEIDRDAFETGLAEASARHPLLNCLLERRSFGKMFWVPPGNVRPEVHWAGIDAPIRFPADAGIDLEREVGMRMYVRVGRGRSRLVIQFHHACCDGVGAVQFIADLLTGYVRAYQPNSSKAPEFQPTDPERYRVRNDVWPHWENLRELGEIAMHAARSMIEHERHQPTPIAAPTAAPGGSEFEFPCTMTRTLGDGAHSALRKVARLNDVTVHELMIRELLMTIREWNIRQGQAKETDWYSVIVPVNARTYEHDGLPAANLVGCSSILRSSTACAEAATLLDSIRAESMFSRRTRFPATFITALKFLDWIPNGAQLLANRGRCCASAFLSSMGDPSRAIAAQYPLNADGNPIMGNLVLSDVNSAPAIKFLTRAAFATWHFKGKQRLAVRVDPTVFSADQGAALLQAFSDRVVALAETAISSGAAIRRAA